VVSESHAADYAAVAAGGCGLLPTRDDGKLLITGPDAAGLLDGQLSNDVAALEIGEGCRAALLTGKGRMLADVRVMRRDDGYLLLTDRTTLQTLYDRLKVGVIGWQAEIVKRTLELARIELIGAGSDTIVDAAGYVVPGPATHACSGDAVRTDDGLEVLVAAADGEQARSRLIAHGARPVDLAVAEIRRVEAARPAWGHELDEQTMPEEAGIVDEAVSFTKGCYVGQETVARLHWKGKPNRHLRKLQLELPASEGTPVTAAGDASRELGKVATAVTSPEQGHIALAMLRRQASPFTATYPLP
jgi:folate-binding protein YgfZ